jgi:hypothetical protein
MKAQRSASPLRQDPIDVFSAAVALPDEVERFTEERPLQAI